MEERYSKAVSLAAAMLGRRSLSESQLEQKLWDKEVEPDAIAYAVERMKDCGGLDDVEFAHMKAQSFANRGYGSYRIEMELQKRGIERELSKQASREVQREEDQLVRFIQSKCQGENPDWQQKQKVLAALYRKGFQKEEIDAAWEQYDQEIGEE